MNYSSLTAVLLLLTAVSIRFPLPIWLVVTAAVITTFFLSYEELKQQHLKRMLCFLFITSLAFIIPLPLPTTWSPAVRLAIIIGVWGIAFSVLNGFLEYRAQRQLKS